MFEQNMKIVQAICIICQKPISNLFDVMYEGLESELVSHKCETCESPVETKMEFIFPGMYYFEFYKKPSHLFLNGNILFILQLFVTNLIFSFLLYFHLKYFQVL